MSSRTVEIIVNLKAVGLIAGGLDESVNYVLIFGCRYEVHKTPGGRRLILVDLKEWHDMFDSQFVEPL